MHNPDYILFVFCYLAIFWVDLVYEQNAKMHYAGMDEGRKRVLAIVARILVALVT